MKTFTIKRSKWARGGKNGSSSLLNHEGTMCCLGFFAKNKGATAEEIYLQGAPCGFFDVTPRARRYALLRKFRALIGGTASQEGRWDNTPICQNVISINDNCDISEDSRESQLSELFAKLGWKPKFIA